MTKRHLALGFLIVFALCLPVLAQEVGPTPTPVVTPMPGPGGEGSGFPLFLHQSIGHFILLAISVFVIVSGLKNMKPFADFFERWPILGTVTNVGLSTLIALKVCYGQGGMVEGFGFINCVLGALGLALGAAGVHLVATKFAPKNTIDKNGNLRTAPSPAVSRKTLDDLRIRSAPQQAPIR